MTDYRYILYKLRIGHSQAQRYVSEMPRPKRFPNRREIQTDAEFDAMVERWRVSTGLSYAETVRHMCECADRQQSDSLKELQRLGQEIER